jgi:hypothetical protein
MPTTAPPNQDTIDYVKQIHGSDYKSPTEYTYKLDGQKITTTLPNGLELKKPKPIETVASIQDNGDGLFKLTSMDGNVIKIEPTKTPTVEVQTSVFKENNKLTPFKLCGCILRWSIRIIV